MQNWKWVFTGLLALILGDPETSRGEIFTISVPSGPYSFDQRYEVAVPIDLETTLQSVQSVTLHVSGELTAGINYDGHLLAGGFGTTIEDYGSDEWHSFLTGLYGISTWPQPEQFDSWTFESYGKGSWTCLLDGKSTLLFELGVYSWFPEDPPPTQPFSTVYTAEVIINATPAPEPGTIAMLAMGGLLLGKRRFRAKSQTTPPPLTSPTPSDTPAPHP